MPIRPELRKKYYGAEWQRYRLVLLKISGGRCSVCGRRFEPHQLDAAHLTHDPRDMELVSMMCKRDHSRNDALHSFAVRRRTRARRAGQLWLLPEIEYAPFASWMVPRRVLDAAQQKLFG
jgi:hypothetical protein